MYKIIRFYQTGEQEIIQTGLTLDEVKEYCNNPETSDKTFFDGFSEE